MFGSLKAEALCAKLLKAGIAFGRVNSVTEFSKHPQLRRVEVATEKGPVNLPAPPAQVSGEKVSLRPVPALGEHSNRIRQEFG